MEISCYWLSASGHGGPTLSPKQMARLADLGLEIEFDAYALGGADDSYLARSFRAMNEHALGRGRAPGAENADGESPDTGSRAVFPVLRVDLADDPRVPLDAKTDVAEVFSTPEAAWRRARELNELHAGNGVKFLWKAATLREKPPAGDLDR